MLEFLRIISSPLVFLFAFIVSARNYFFDHRYFKIKKVDAKVISVGNLTVGGSGKTPSVILLGKILKARGRKIGVLSRGYGRDSRGYKYISDGEKIFTTPKDGGDEIWLVANELKCAAAVCERRVKGAKRLIKEAKVDSIILDDAFQHRWIHRDLDLVLIDQRFLIKVGFIEQKPLPLGMMREPFESLKRADVIIINRKFSDKLEIPEKLRLHFENKKVFTAFYNVQGIYDVKTHHEFPLNEFQGQKSLVVCGIARPHSFLRVLEKNKIDIKNKFLYPDHANYSKIQVQQIRKKFYDTNCYSVLTTQKDAVKLSNFSKELDDIDIYFVKIEMKIDEQPEFEEILINALV
jgi:tetraacyldisaccharide 4'-kinase